MMAVAVDGRGSRRNGRVKSVRLGDELVRGSTRRGGTHAVCERRRIAFAQEMLEALLLADLDVVGVARVNRYQSPSSWNSLLGERCLAELSKSRLFLAHQLAIHVILVSWSEAEETISTRVLLPLGFRVPVPLQGLRIVWELPVRHCEFDVAEMVDGGNDAHQFRGL